MSLDVSSLCVFFTGGKLWNFIEHSGLRYAEVQVRACADAHKLSIQVLLNVLAFRFSQSFWSCSLGLVWKMKCLIVLQYCSPSFEDGPGVARTCFSSSEQPLSCRSGILLVLTLCVQVPIGLLLCDFQWAKNLSSLILQCLTLRVFSLLSGKTCNFSYALNCVFFVLCEIWSDRFLFCQQTPFRFHFPSLKRVAIISFPPWNRWWSSGRC